MSDLFPIPPGDMLAVRRMTPEEAEQWLLVTHPDLPLDVHEKLVASAKGSVVPEEPPRREDPPAKPYTRKTTPPPDPDRRRFLALAWIAGASWAQIASMFGIARQTVMDQVNRILPPHKREEFTGRRSTMTYGQLHALRETFNKNPSSYGGESLYDAAMLLREDSADYD